LITHRLTQKDNCSAEEIQYITMPDILYREATQNDIPFLAALRAKNRETEIFWINSITSYIEGTRNPQQALPSRVLFVAYEGEQIVGFIAGHLTRRYQCDGELEWIDVAATHRRKGIASELILVLAKWFIYQRAYKICIDPGNDVARKFYYANGAAALNDHWMFWNDISTIIGK